MKRLDWLLPGCVLLLFVALQLPPMRHVSVAEYDESIFLDIARNIHDVGVPLRNLGPGGRLELDQTPLYLYFLSGLTLVVGEDLFLLRLVTLGAATVCIALIYAIGRRVGDRVAGLVAALLLAVNPFFNLYSFFLRMEVFAALFVLVAIYLMATDDARPTNRHAAGAGLAIMTATMLKITAITFWMAALPWAVWRLWRAAERRRRLAWLALPTMVAVGVWLTAAWLDPARAVSAGRWGAALGIGGSAVDARLDVQLRGWLGAVIRTVLGWETVALLGVAVVVALPRLYKSRMVGRSGTGQPNGFVSRGTCLPPCLARIKEGETTGEPGADKQTRPFAGCLAPIIASRRLSRLYEGGAKDAIVYLLALYIGLTFGLLLVVQLKEIRHLFGILPAVALFIGLALPWQAWLSSLRGKRGAAVVAGVGVMAFLWALSPLQLPRGGDYRSGEMWWSPVVRGRYFHNDGQLASLREVGLYLAANTPEDAFILVARQGPVVGYYANRHYAFLYTGDFERNMGLLRDGEYLVMDPPLEYWAQSPEETVAMQRYIAEHYRVVEIFHSGEREVILYRNSKGRSTKESAPSSIPNS